MSRVTNLILSFSILEDKEERIKNIHSFHNNGRGFKLVSADFEEYKTPNIRWYGGSKKLETNLFIGAYNHLDLEGLILHLKNMIWEESEYVQLIVQEEHDDKFRIIELV